MPPAVETPAPFLDKFSLRMALAVVFVPQEWMRRLALLAKMELEIPP
jgi:hypothetical protein